MEVFNEFYSSLKVDGYNIINKIADINSDIFLKEPLKTICLDSNRQLVIMLVNIVISMIVMYYALMYILSLYSGASVDKIYFYIIKFVIIAIVCVNSFELCKEIINLNALFTDLTDGFLEDISGKKMTYEFLDESNLNIEDILKNIDKKGINTLKDFTICTYITLLIFFLSTRYVVVIICIIVSPFIFIFALDKRSVHLVHIWFKTFIYCLIVQIINKVIMFIPVVSKKEDIYFSLLIGSLFVMYKTLNVIGELYGKNK